MKMISLTTQSKALIILLLALFSTSIFAGENSSDRASIEFLFSILDNPGSTAEAKAKTFTDDAIILSPGKQAIIGEDAVLDFFTQGENDGRTIMRHRIYEIDSYPEIVVLRGGAIGYFSPKSSEEKHPWESNFLIVLERTNDDGLLIQQDAYNMLPSPSMEEVMRVLNSR